MDLMYVIGGMGAFLVVVVAAFYAVSSMAVVRVLKKFGYERPSYGWIPAVRDYALGTVCIQKSGSLTGMVKAAAIPNVWLQWGWAAVIAADMIPGIGAFLGIIVSVFYYGTVYQFIYSRLFGDGNVVITAVSAVVRPVFYIRILVCLHEKESPALRSQPDDLYPRNAADMGDGTEE